VAVSATPLRSTWTWLIVLALLAGILRAAALEQVAPNRLVGDEVYYATVANNIAQGRGHVFDDAVGVTSRALRPPAHPYVMSLFAAGGRRSLLRLQVVLGSLLVVVTALLGNALFDARTGFVAGLLAALYPTFIAYSHYLWSETLFAVLVTGAFLGVVRARRRPCLILAAATGLCFGAAALTREIAIPIAAASALWWACTAPRGLRRQAAGLGATMLACAALVVLPWTYRNYTAFGRLVPVATVGWFAAAEGNTWEAATWLRGGGPRQREFFRGYYARPAEIERLEFARRHTIERVRAEQPTWIFKKLARTVVQLLGPDGSLRQKTRAGVYRDLSPALVQALLAGSYLYSALLVAAGAWGIAGARGGGRRLLPCLVLGVAAAIHVAANATSRFRLPWMPLLIAYASHALLVRPRIRLGRASDQSE